MTEVLAPTMIDYAPPELAAAMVPRLLRGEETWCQGFSEPGHREQPRPRSSCRATRSGDGWRVTGQKVWTSLAQYADRCVLLTRTGPPDSAHTGITALFVDMDSPGITVRPIETMHGAPRVLRGLLRRRRRARRPHPRSRRARAGRWPWTCSPSSGAPRCGTAPPTSTGGCRASSTPSRRTRSTRTAVGEVAQLLYALRARSRATQYRLAAGERLGPETSVDKVLVATAEQAVFDLVADGLGPELAGGDDPASERWRREFLYSRAATIYGGTAEIQRNIIARRLLDLGPDR